MVVRFRNLSRVSAVILISGVALASCSQDDTDALAAPAEPAPAQTVSVVDSLSPDALMLRALECRSSLAPLRHGHDDLPGDLMARVARAADVSFGDLVFGAGNYGVSMEARRDAHTSGRSVPRSAEETTPEYIQYISTCADIMDRAASVLSEAKAAEA